jgi:hypothetical protein
VTIDGSGIALPDDLVGLFHISGKEYIRVSELRVINARPNNDNAGIMVLDSSNIIVENNSTYNTNSSGVGVWGSDNVTVDGNRIEEAGGGGWQECISVAGTAGTRERHAAMTMSRAIRDSSTLLARASICRRIYRP